MNDESKIISLLREAKPRQAGRSVSLAVVALFIAVVGLAVTGTYIYMSSRLSEASMMAATLESEKQAARAGLQAARAELEAERAETARLAELLAYVDKLHLQDVKMKNSDGVLTVAGEVRNMGARGVNDIELTAYFLGQDGKPVTEHRYVARSSDGRPLYRHQRRQFRFTVNPAPERASDISLVITGVQFD